jgi:MoaA/NifB/PqqE/SkfB family radical SAM enzyme
MKNGKNQMQNNTVCVYPWILLSVGSNGGLRPCCNALHADIESEKGVRANITEMKDYSLDSFLNTHTHKELRESMLVGERHPMCGRCWKMEDSGMKSFRESINQRYPELRERIHDEIPLGIHRIEFDLGKKCNLRCRMCAPFSSSLIGKETQKHPESRSYYEMDYDSTEWVDAISMRDVVSPHLDTLQEIYMIGGEPLIIDAHEELLTYLLETGSASKIKLVYNTNGIFLGKKFIDMWKQFRFVQLNVSIDGVGKQYEYIRNPAKWETIESNMKLLMAEIKDVRNIECGVTPTLQNLTISNNSLRDLFLWCEDLGLSMGVIPVNRPDFLQADVMPEEIYEYYLQEFKNIKPQIKINVVEINNTINYLESNKSNLHNSDLQKKFVQKQLLLDKIRNQDVFETHPWAKQI